MKLSTSTLEMSKKKVSTISFPSSSCNIERQGSSYSSFFHHHLPLILQACWLCCREEKRAKLSHSSNLFVNFVESGELTRA